MIKIEGKNCCQTHFVLKDLSGKKDAMILNQLQTFIPHANRLLVVSSENLKNFDLKKAKQIHNGIHFLK